MLLLHGVTDSWLSFERVLPYLPESINATALTQRGHGDADRPATGYRTRDYAADVAAFLDAVGLGAAVIVGDSMGGPTPSASRSITPSAREGSCWPARSPATATTPT